MKYTRPLIATATALAVLCPLLSHCPPAYGRESVETQLIKRAGGKRERKMSRRDQWIESLEGDKKRIYLEYGSPTGRYREEAMGIVVEKWVYADTNKTFTFKGNNLIHEH